MGGKATGGERVPRERVPLLVAEFVQTIGYTKEYIIAGSYRRGLETVGDIELILVSDTEFERSFSLQLIASQFGLLKTKPGPQMIGLFKGVQFDLHTCLRTTLGALLLHTTGSWQFNKFLRTRAMLEGFKLNQYGLFDSITNEREVISSDEFAFFDRLGLPDIHPFMRSVCSKFVDLKGGKITITETGFRYFQPKMESP